MPPQFHDALQPLESSEPPFPSWILFWQELFAGALWVGYAILLIGMIYYCVRNDPNWFFWLWVMLIAQPFGAIAYFLIRFLPSRNFEDWSLLKRWRKAQTLPRLESAARHIGNAYQFVQWGDALRDLNRNDQASRAYARAIEKEPENLSALWGAAKINFLQKNWNEARDQLSRILAKESSFKFGDVSLLYAKTLLELDETEAATQHLQQHVKKWRQPEALYLLGQEYAAQGNVPQARKQLEGLISDLDASPRSIARKSIFWKSRAQRLLRSLPRSSSQADSSLPPAPQDRQ